MASVRRRSGAVRVELAPDEAGEIDSLIEQLAALVAPSDALDAGEEAPDDALAGLEWPGPTLGGLEWPGSQAVDVPDDPARAPVVARRLPRRP